MTAHSPLLTKSPAQKLAPGKPLTLTGIADGAEGLVIADLARSIAAGAKKPPAISIAVICRDGSRMATLSVFLRPTSKSWNSRPGIACPTTASRRTPPWWRSG
jgi:hypothetical protein